MENPNSVVQHLSASSDQFMFQVYLPVMIWMGSITIVILFLLKKYTFGNWTTQNPNPYAGETFDMPRGVMRGILSITLLFVTIVFELVAVHTPGFEAEMQGLMTSFQMMLAFYFGSKVMHHVTSAERQKTEITAQAQVSAAQAVNPQTTTSNSTEEEPMG